MNNIFSKLKNWYRSTGSTSKGSKTSSSSYNTIEEEDQTDFSYNNPWLSIRDTKSTNS